MKTGKLISIALLSLAMACSKENVTSNQGGSDANQGSGGKPCVLRIDFL